MCIFATSINYITMKYDLDYVKDLYVVVEEWDPDEAGSYYTTDYKISEKFSDEEIDNEFSEWDEGEELADVILWMVNDSLSGDLKGIYIKDNKGVVLKDDIGME